MLYTTPPDDFAPKFHIAGCNVRSGQTFLLLHRAPHKPEGGMWGVPAGKLEKGETALEAIARELHEESGLVIAPKMFTAMGVVYIRYPDKDFVWHLFSTELSKQPNIILQPDEHDEYAWVAPNEAFTMDLMPDVAPAIKRFYSL